MSLRMQLKYISCFLSVMLFATAQAQDGPPIRKDSRPFIIRGTIGIPKTLTSNQFRNSFNGLYEANLSFNFRLYTDVYMGIGYQSNYFQNNTFLRFKVFKADIPYNTRLIGDSPYIRFSYQKFFRSNAYWEYGLNYGFMVARYTGVNEDTTAHNKPFGSQKFNAHYVQPEVSANFIVDQNLSFCFFFSYNTLFSKFNPKAPRFNQFEEVSLKTNNYFMSWFTFGFGFNVLLGKSK